MVTPMISLFSNITCGEACWHAREEVCKCSCGGKNHGCLRPDNSDTARVRPERVSKIAGHAYKLVAVGRHADIRGQAAEINQAAGYRSIDKPSVVIDGIGSGPVTPEEIAAARAAGKTVWWHQYSYYWSTTDEGAPARLKTASASQRKWAELDGWKDEREVYLLWERIEKPARPTIPIVNKETGEPEADQTPKLWY